jgi:hypothetical protein
MGTASTSTVTEQAMYNERCNRRAVGVGRGGSKRGSRAALGSLPRHDA